jgi:hypothetical protein
MAREAHPLKPSSAAESYLTTALPHISICFHLETSLSPIILEQSVWVKLNCSELFSTTWSTRCPQKLDDRRSVTITNHTGTTTTETFSIHLEDESLMFYPRNKSGSFKMGMYCCSNALTFEVPAKGGTAGARHSSPVGVRIRDAILDFNVL